MQGLPDNLDESGTMVFFETQEGAFAEDDSSLFAGVCYTENADGETYTRHFYRIDLKSGVFEELYSDERTQKDNMRRMMYQSSADTLIAICDSADERCAADIICLNTETGEKRWETVTPPVENEGRKLYWLLSKMCTLLDEEEGHLYVGRKQKLYLLDVNTGRILTEAMAEENGTGILPDEIVGLHH